MKPTLTRPQRRALRKARATSFPFVVTGFLIDPVIVGTIALGKIYHHSKADPRTGRFVDGHMIHTSWIAGFVEYGGFVVLITRNSQYACVVSNDEKSALIWSIQSVPKPTFH